MMMERFSEIYDKKITPPKREDLKYKKVAYMIQGEQYFLQVNVKFSSTFPQMAPVV